MDETMFWPLNEIRWKDSRKSVCTTEKWTCLFSILMLSIIRPYLTFGKKRNLAGKKQRVHVWVCDWHGYWGKMSLGICLNKVTIAPSLICIKLSERNIILLSPPLVYFSMLPHHATPHGPPDTCTQSLHSGIKRRIVWKRGKTHLINLPGTFHSTAVSFTSKFTFTWRWKWLIPKPSPQNAKCSASTTTNNLHSL